MQNTRLKVTGIVLVLALLGYGFALSDLNPLYHDDTYREVHKELTAGKMENDLDTLAALYIKMYAGRKNKPCPCKDAAYVITARHHGIFNRLYHFKLEREFSDEECIKFLLLHSEGGFGFGKKDVHQAAAYYFHKSVPELNEAEQITMLLLLENPSYFNPVRRRDKVSSTVRMYQNVLQANEHN
ncbi:transglycosylase domain-containing protein [Flavobacterium sp.]|uniref:transglycosylase domain-containing protein n=1 Tax=Flavobacterium sp. TaxID=239 RepID=UPI00263A1F52|nr:transglycosylase domain-containing protein [Flavobacterium sp.]